jgi:squalene synthase HpnC
MGSENFPVASFFLPTELRRHLVAVYGFARLVDQLGDSYRGDRPAALDWVDREVTAALQDPLDTGIHPLVGGAAGTVRATSADPALLRALVEANRRDQHVGTYATFADLEGYCRLSAQPVGRLVLAVFGVADPERTARSDQVCTGLQLAEHWQDVAEDHAAGRVYLPEEDLVRFGVSADQLSAGAAPAGPEVRALLAFEAARARRLLDEGRPLVAGLRGRPRWAVAGFVAGGHAALDALADQRFDPLTTTPRPRLHRFLPRLLDVMRAGRDGQGRP